MTTFLTLAEWGGTPNGWPEMVLPVRNLDVHHSVTNEEVGVPGTADAISDFRELDAIGLGRGHGGISYSYAIHPEGTIGEGQGTRRGAHTAGDGCNHSPWGWNPCTIGVVFIGDFQPSEGVAGDVLTVEAIESFRWLRDKLITDGILAPGTYPTGGHRDMAGNPTACPGENIEEQLAALRAASTPTTEEQDMYAIEVTDTGNGLTTGQTILVTDLTADGVGNAVPTPGLVRVKMSSADAKATIDKRAALVAALSPKASGGAGGVPIPPVAGAGTPIDYAELAKAITAGIKGL